ncbi:MAG TPA: hypothetical protein HA232_03125, partial [Methanocellales archaeon]|nr:hypothetical protein [Methanocellales archaeon]
ADVHLILDHIREEEYSCETPDGRGKTKEDVSRRIARLICGDMDMLDGADVMCMANHVYKKQVEQIQAGLIHVIEQQHMDINTPVILAGTGAHFLGNVAIRQLGYIDILYFEDFVERYIGLSAEKASLSAPAFSMAVLLTMEGMVK